MSQKVDWKELFLDIYVLWRHWKLKWGIVAIIFFFFVLFLLLVPDLWPSRIVFVSSYAIITLVVLFLIFYWKRRTNVMPSPDPVMENTYSEDEGNWIGSQGNDPVKSFEKRYLLVHSLIAIFALSFYGLYSGLDYFVGVGNLDPITNIVLFVSIPLILTVFVFLLFYKYYYKKKN